MRAAKTVRVVAGCCLAVLATTVTLTAAAAAEQRKVAAKGADEDDLNLWPVIGVFTQPSTDSYPDCGGSCDYLAASYVRWVEAAGGRVVPIPYNANDSYVDYITSSVNGILFPGGGSALPDAAVRTLNNVLAANDAGDYMPLWGTCLGFEWLVMAVADDTNILDSGYDAWNISLALDFEEGNVRDSYLLQTVGSQIVKIMGTEDVTMNNHQSGIAPDHLESTPALDDFFNILSTNEDRAGLPFVSLAEAKSYPVWGTQFHPEKNTFEWGMENGAPYEAINHSPDAMEMTAALGTFFMNEARKNHHSFPSEDEESAALIYNFPVTYTPPEFIETYYFQW